MLWDGRTYSYEDFKRQQAFREKTSRMIEAKVERLNLKSLSHRQAHSVFQREEKEAEEEERVPEGCTLGCN